MVPIHSVSVYVTRRGGFEYLRILPGRSKVVLARLVRLFDLVAVPHWPEECSFGKHLDFCGVFTCELLEKRRVLVIPCGGVGCVLAHGLTTL